MVSDYWPGDVLAFDITVKDVLALSNKLESFKLSIKESRVDVHVDSLALFHPWNGQSAKSNGLDLKVYFQQDSGVQLCSANI